MDDRQARVVEKLLAWYRVERRDLPWRRTRDPYAILVAEVVLQRTRIKAGLPYYERFLARFPTVHALAEASEAKVLREWEGLGFYSRARKLHEAARAIVAHHGGAIPADFAALRSLPGVGPYTAGALGSIAFGLRVPAVDGNARRVLSRLFWSRLKIRAAALDPLAHDLVPPDAPGDWNQAVMDLGATICIPRRPRCGVCPVSAECDAFTAGVQAHVPPRAAATHVPTRKVMFAIIEERGRVLLARRPPRGLLAGLWSLPGGEAASGAELRGLVREQTGLDVSVLETVAKVRHVFSHLRWSGRIARAQVRGGRTEGAQWFPREELGSIAMVPFHRRALVQASPSWIAPLDSQRRKSRKESNLLGPEAPPG